MKQMWKNIAPRRFDLPEPVATDSERSRRMSSLTRKQSGRRLLLREQEARELRKALFRLIGQDPEYQGVITGDLRGYWQAVALPADDPNRFNFRGLRERVREGNANT